MPEIRAAGDGENACHVIGCHSLNKSDPNVSWTTRGRFRCLSTEERVCLGPLLLEYDTISQVVISSAGGEWTGPDQGGGVHGVDEGGLEQHVEARQGELRRLGDGAQQVGRQRLDLRVADNVADSLWSGPCTISLVQLNVSRREEEGGGMRREEEGGGGSMGDEGGEGGRRREEERG